MLGHRLWLDLSAHFEVWATVRTGSLPLNEATAPERIIGQVDALRTERLIEVIGHVRPAVLINCVGVIKQRPEAQQPLPSLDLNARLPHLLADICRAADCRLIHISTDCVFAGDRGGYREDMLTDATDLYGRTKALGEVTTQPHSLTMRTSIIGHELHTAYGLIEWFLSQRGSVRGFQRAIFSGFPTTVLAAILRDHVLPNPSLHGLYQVAAEPISKYDLLMLCKTAYAHPVEIVPESEVAIERSLNGERFRAATGFTAPSWPSMIETMAAQRGEYAQFRG
jgi:dTDP-4-dehydrorhamnose reductase